MVTPMVEQLEQITTATEKSIAVSLAAGAIRNVPVKPTATFGVHVRPAPLPFRGVLRLPPAFRGEEKVLLTASIWWERRPLAPLAHSNPGDPAQKEGSKPAHQSYSVMTKPAARRKFDV